jgi:type I restriction enzyme S subunit
MDNLRKSGVEREPWISLADSPRLDNVYITDTQYQISQLGIENSSAVLHPNGTVVLSRDAGVGKSAIMKGSMAASQHFMCWRCGPHLDNHYLYYWLQHRKRDFENIATGSTIPTIGLNYFKKYRIGLPSLLEEQKAIAIRMLAVDTDLLARNNHLQKQRQLKAGLMQDLLTGRVRVPLTELTTA